MPQIEPIHPVHERFYTIGLDAYQPGVEALARSFRRHHPGARLVAVHPIDRPYAAPWKERFAAEGAETLGLDFTRVRDAFARSGTRAQGRHGEETYAKALLADELDAPFWWIDSDIIVKRDLRSMLATLPRSAVCALSPSPDGGINLNGGLAWFDPIAMRTSGLMEAFFAQLTAHGHTLKTADEEIFNQLRTTFRIASLPINAQRWVMDDGSRIGSDEAYAYHYLGPTKPWMTGARQAARLAWLEQQHP